MTRVSRVATHLSEAQVKAKLNSAANFRQQQKWLVVYNALVDPRPAEAIAKHTGTSLRTVHQVVSDYNRFGSAAIETPGKGGRRRSYLSWEAEVNFLAPFVEQAVAGHISTVALIQQAFEQQVGQAVDSSTIYRLLERHQWRKLVPRPAHPQAVAAQQAAFKQTSHSKSNNS
ncbi:hypothetical protein AVDCRST_MAG94-2217 [uncultured Leptolyngbya sp.]|uniref:Winged helix-turn helix domain-containing protein n=1 Tax=uncultured Leptolyngbya sp. TaxID=332963 RepID=A0A6J4LQN3_9CYAN|nr:hypothetical protein AVDCRST_MAG94-2217 [uncultured Leptolyngbya sp.]